MNKAYVTYELTFSDTPTETDPNGALQNGQYIQSVKKLGTRTVMADTLNVRTGPSILSNESHELHAGARVTVFQLVGEWARISESLADWVHVRYLGL